jgi:hypothetical protein
VPITQKFAVVDPSEAVFVGPASGEGAFPAVIREKRQRLVRRIRMGWRQAWRESRHKQQQANYFTHGFSPVFF